MKKHILFTLIACFVFSHQAARARTGFAIVQGRMLKFYEEIVIGIKNAFPDAPFQRIVLEDDRRPDLVADIVKNRPEFILAFGDDALRSVKSIRSIPILCVMVFDPAAIPAGSDNIASIDIRFAGERKFGIIRKALPHVASIGMFYDPKRPSVIVSNAGNSAEKLGIKLVLEKVGKPEDVNWKIGRENRRVPDAFRPPNIHTGNGEDSLLFLF